MHETVGSSFGSVPAVGGVHRRRVRRDEGIPPYGRPEGGGRPGLALNAKFIRRGGIYPARGVRAAANIPGTMRASSPTEVCYNAGPRFLGWLRHSPSSVGADSISARGCLRRRGVRRDGGIPPYGRPEGGGRPCLAPNTEFIRRGGIYPARGTLRRRGVRRDEGIPPYGRPEGGGRPCLALNTKFIRRGGIYPARGTLRRRRAPGTMRASSPTGVCCNAGAAVSRLAAAFSPVPQGGRSRPPHLGDLKLRRLRRCRVRRDEGIPPYGRPEGGGRPGLAPNTKFIRRGGIYPARGTLRHRGVRRDGGIPPHGRPVGCGCPVSRVISEGL